MPCLAVITVTSVIDNSTDTMSYHVSAIPIQKLERKHDFDIINAETFMREGRAQFQDIWPAEVESESHTSCTQQCQNKRVKPESLI
jgi:hypothetical protein